MYPSMCLNGFCSSLASADEGQSFATVYLQSTTAKLNEHGTVTPIPILRLDERVEECEIEQ
jgi:hypothetical protein